MPFRSMTFATATLGALTMLAAAPLAAASGEDCKVDARGKDHLVTSDDTPLDPTDDPTLSETLDPCDGVLKPEPVGDPEMTVTPPAGGVTPVIEPDELPPQAPQDE